MDYRNKYLKYKKKYLELKDLLGGFTYDISNVGNGIEFGLNRPYAKSAALNNGISSDEFESTFNKILESEKNNNISGIKSELEAFNNKHENITPDIYSRMKDNIKQFPIMSSNSELPDRLPADTEQ